MGASPFWLILPQLKQIWNSPKQAEAEQTELMQKMHKLVHKN